MSAPALRGQSKHKATPSNLLHPMLRRTCPNGTGLLRITMSRALFAQPYIDVKHMPGLSQSPDFISLSLPLMGQKLHFPPSSTERQKDGISHGEAASHPSNKITESWSMCVRKERNKAVLASFGNPTPYYDILFLFPFTESLLVEFKEVANRAWFYLSLTDGANNGMDQSNERFCGCQTLLIRLRQIQTKWQEELLLLVLETGFRVPKWTGELVVSVGFSSLVCL